VRGHVADAFEVGRDLERRGDQAEIARRWLVEGEELQAEIVDLDVEPVDRVVAVDDRPRQRRVALGQRPDRLCDLVLDEAAHLEDRRAELRELLLVAAIGVLRHQPNRPVM
jgi:hypothetical protein